MRPSGRRIRAKARTTNPNAIALGAQTTGYRTISDAIHAMSRLRTDLQYKPDPKAKKQYDKLYALYRELANTKGAVANVMRQLRQYSHLES